MIKDLSNFKIITETETVNIVYRSWSGYQFFVCYSLTRELRVLMDTDWPVDGEPCQTNSRAASASYDNCAISGVRYRPLQLVCRLIGVGVGDGGHVPPKRSPPPQKNWENIFGQLSRKIRTFSGKCHGKFRNFVNFSDKYNKSLTFR